MDYVISALSGAIGAVIGAAIGAILGAYMTSRYSKKLWLHQERAKAYATFFEFFFSQWEHHNDEKNKTLSYLALLASMYASDAISGEFARLSSAINRENANFDVITEKALSLYEKVRTDIQDL